MARLSSESRTRTASAVSTAVIALLIPTALVLSIWQWYQFHTVNCRLLDRYVWVPYLLGGLLITWLFRSMLSKYGRPRASVLRRTRYVATVIFAPWLVLCLLIPQFLGTVDRGKQKRTLGSMREIAAVIESYAMSYGEYPQLDGMDAFLAKFSDDASDMAEDAWGYEFAIQSSKSHCRIISYARCGVPDCGGDEEYDLGSQTIWEADIILENGQFIRWPSGLQGP